MRTATKSRIGIATGLAVLAAAAFTPRSAPVWVRDIMLLALVVVLMAVAAVVATVRERLIGPGSHCPACGSCLHVTHESGDAR